MVNGFLFHSRGGFMWHITHLCCLSFRSPALCLSQCVSSLCLLNKKLSSDVEHLFVAYALHSLKGHGKATVPEVK